MNVKPVSAARRSTFVWPPPCAALADLDPSSGSHDPDSGGGLLSFLNSTRSVIGAVTALVVAVSGLLIALNKTGVVGGDDDGSNGGPTTQPGTGLFAPMTSPIGRVYFDRETMYVKAAKARRRLLHLAQQEEALRDVAMSTRVSWVSGARDYGISLVCRYDSRSDYYAVAILSGGRYNIIRYRDGRPHSLTGGIKQGSGATEDANDMTARCVGQDPTTLTLELNGRTVASAQDPNGVESGNVGLRVGSDESFVTIRFEDFVLRSL